MCSVDALQAALGLFISVWKSPCGTPMCQLCHVTMTPCLIPTLVIMLLISLPILDVSLYFRLSQTEWLKTYIFLNMKSLQSSETFIRYIIHFIINTLSCHGNVFVSRDMRFESQVLNLRHMGLYALENMCQWCKVDAICKYCTKMYEISCLLI